MSGAKPRILPPEEWHKLDALGLRGDLVKPGDLTVFVLEDGERIVATWTLMRVSFLEGLWIDPEYRANLGAARALIAPAFAKAGEFASWALIGAADDKIARYLTRLGGNEMPMKFFAVPMGRVTCRQQ